MSAVIYARACGWHIIVSVSGDTMESRLRPVVVGKAHVDYIRPGNELSASDQLAALTAGLANIWEGQPSECHNL